MAESLTDYSAADIVRALLVADGVCSAVSDAGVPAGDWPAYSEDEPDKPDECVTIYTTEGKYESRNFIDMASTGPQGVLVRVRAARAGDAYAKASAVSAYLSNGTINGVRDTTKVVRRGLSYGGRYWLIHSFEDIGNLVPLGRESPTSRRSLVTFNAQIVVEDQTPT